MTKQYRVQPRRLFVISIACGLVAALNALIFRRAGIAVDPFIAAAIAFGGALPFLAFYQWAFSRNPHLPALTRYFAMIMPCLPITLFASFFAAGREFGFWPILRSNLVFDWPIYLSHDILLTLPVFAIGAAMALWQDGEPTRRPPAEAPEDAAVALKRDWMDRFWIEAILHANIAVIASVIMGAGTLANRLSLWMALFFMAIAAIQLAWWGYYRLRRKLAPAFVRWLLISLPFINWGRIPKLMEHGVEAIGSGIGMWTIALLTTAVISARLLKTTLFVLTIATAQVVYFYHDHQHADGWFEQATIAFIVGSFSLVVALAAHSIYRQSAEDRSALARAVEREQAATRQAALETERRRRILRAVGHDLRQPLSALQLWLFAAGRRGAGDLKELREAKSAVSSAHDILDSIAQLSLVIDGEKDPRLSVTPLAPFMEELASETRMLAGAAGMGVRCRPLYTDVIIDAFLLRRILRNFVVNAVKHGKSGDILIAARRRGDFVHILVIDQGGGIPPEAQQRIFEEFERSSDGTTADEGIGIGLAVARDLAKAMNVEITLQSIVGKGSAFGVKVPLAPSRA